MHDEVANYAQGFCAHPALLRQTRKNVITNIISNIYNITGFIKLFKFKIYTNNFI
jgi:hypothetical protein